MANENQTAQTKPTVPAANGSAPTAPTAAPAKHAPREVPLIGVSATKDEYNEIKAAFSALLGGLDLKVGFGPFVLACALRDIRRSAAAKAAQPVSK